MSKFSIVPGNNVHMELTETEAFRLKDFLEGVFDMLDLDVDNSDTPIVHIYMELDTVLSTMDSDSLQ
jgi:hypothetical protein